MMRAIAGSTASNSRVQHLPRDLAERAGELNAGRAAADQHERQQPSLIHRVRFALGLFERQQDAAANRQRIVERLETRRGLAPFVVAEVRMRRAGGDDQVVVRQRRSPPIEVDDLLRRRIDVLDVGEQHAQARLLAQDPADRRGDVARRQPGRRHLIQQRLKDVMVVAIDDRHLAGDVAEAPRRGEPGKPAANDDHLGQACHLLYSMRCHAKAWCCPT